jgi:hypothetical protein
MSRFLEIILGYTSYGTISMLRVESLAISIPLDRNPSVEILASFATNQFNHLI